MRLRLNDIEAIKKISRDLEPEYKDWQYVQHCWCLETSEAIETHLTSKGIPWRPSRINDQLNFFADEDFLHSWVELADGTIIDASIKQFFLPNCSSCECNEEPKEECRLCEAYLDSAHYKPDNLWIVSPSDLYRRHLYIYGDPNLSPEERMPLSNALDGPNPLINISNKILA